MPNFQGIVFTLIEYIGKISNLDYWNLKVNYKTKLNLGASGAEWF